MEQEFPASLLSPALESPGELSDSQGLKISVTILILKENRESAFSEQSLGNSDGQPSVGTEGRGQELDSDPPNNGCVTLGNSLILSDVNFLSCKVDIEIPISQGIEGLDNFINYRVCKHHLVISILHQLSQLLRGLGGEAPCQGFTRSPRTLSLCARAYTMYKSSLGLREGISSPTDISPGAQGTFQSLGAWL